MIEIEGLVRRFGTLTAVGGISLRVAKGEVLGFLGPNGAGKSTTMKMITGYLAPSEGRITVMGHDVVEEPFEAQSAIGYLPEGAPAYPDMTPVEFLNFIARVRGLTDDELAAFARYKAPGKKWRKGGYKQPVKKHAPTKKKKKKATA